VAVPKWEGTRIRIEVRKKNASKQQKKLLLHKKKTNLPGVHKIREVERCLSERCRSGSLQREGTKHLKGKKNILQIFVSFIIIMIVSIMFTTIIGFLKTVCLLNGFHLSCMSNIFVIKH
jgi:hypothetical protein